MQNYAEPYFINFWKKMFEINAKRPGRLKIFNSMFYGVWHSDIGDKLA